MAFIQKVKVQHYPLDIIEESDEFIDSIDNSIDIEDFILQIEDLRLIEILVLRAMGYKYFEIASILEISINEFYILLRDLKRYTEEWLGEE